MSNNTVGAARRPKVIDRVQAFVRWPFTSRYASPIWLALRLYLAYIWFNFGMSKIQGGWLSGDPTGQLFKGILAGNIRIPVPLFREFAAFALDTGLTVALSRIVPFAELAVALSLVSGVLMVPALIGGIFLIINVLLSGIGALSFDGRVILLHVLLIGAWHVAGVIGVEASLVRVLRIAIQSLRPKPQPVPVRIRRR
jgi:uncharacterized membrane protein YphA (DoxX/SURF4 family)